MVFITVEMVRRKSEHNEKEISTLQELSLHQENIEKIQYLQNWCRHLQILLFQSNLISKIENLNKLKNLRYLNLALNNIERVENLEGLESLEKLDLTLNFIGDLSSVASLRANPHLSCLILTGNPCVDFRDYQDFVVASVPQVTELDGTEISRSMRIVARQDLASKMKRVAEDEELYRKKRIDDKTEDSGDSDCDSGDEGFWNKPSKNTPEERVRIAEKAHKIRQKENGKEERKPKREVRRFDAAGRPLNVNQPKIPLKLYDDEAGNKVLDVAVYRYLDSSYIDVDVQPGYVTVRIKGQLLQLVLNEEVHPDTSVCQRSQTTGHLVITMPRVSGTCLQPTHLQKKLEYRGGGAGIGSEATARVTVADLHHIVTSQQWQDNPDVPPLE